MDLLKKNSIVEEDLNNNLSEVGDIPNGMYFLIVRDCVFDIVFEDKKVEIR